MDNYRKKKKKRKVVLTVILVIAALLILICGGVYAGVQLTFSKVRNVQPEAIEKVDPQEETFEIDEEPAAEGTVEIQPEDVVWAEADTEVMKNRDVVNLLLIGQDKREGQGRQRSDTMIMVTINKETKSISMTSFMRDLYVQIPGYSDNRMNAAYVFGGMELLDNVIETNFGVHIDGNVEVDFTAFKTLIDEIGGIELELTKEEADYICGRNQNVLYPQELRTDWNLQGGLNTLNGEQALIHTRNRSIGQSDYRRTERQREVLMAAFNKAKQIDILKLVSMVDELLPYVTTDMSLSEILGYGMEVVKMDIGEMESYRIPADGMYMSATIRGMQVLVPDLEKNRGYLQDVLYGDT